MKVFLKIFILFLPACFAIAFLLCLFSVPAILIGPLSMLLGGLAMVGIIMFFEKDIMEIM